MERQPKNKNQQGLSMRQLEIVAAVIIAGQATHSGAKRLLRTFGIAALLIVVSQVALWSFNSTLDNRPIVGLRLEGDLLGTAFRQQVSTLAHEHETTRFTIKAAHISDSITLQQFGVQVDEEQLRNSLLAVGRRGNLFERLKDQNMAVIGARNLHITQSGFKSETATTYLNNLEKKLFIAPTNATLAYENGKVVMQPDKKGQAIDLKGSLAVLRQANPPRTTTVTLLLTTTTAQVTSPLLTPLLPQVQAIIQKPLTIRAGQSHTTLSPEQLFSVVAVKIVADPANAQKIDIHLSFDEAKLSTIVDSVVKRAVISPTPTVMSNGKVVQQGKDGVQTKSKKPLEDVLAILQQRRHGSSPEVIEIPLVAVKPSVQQLAITRHRTGSGTVRLTFDDGPGGSTEQVLNILGRYNVHATFYVIGRNVQAHPGTMKRIVREGHRIGNHSFSHANLASLSRAGVEQEIKRTQTAVQVACGVTPTAFRPPYGAVNATVRNVAAQNGLSIDMWSVDPLDWARPGSSAITQRVLRATRPGSVILLHSLHQQTVAALPAIIEGIRAQGYTLE